MRKLVFLAVLLALAGGCKKAGVKVVTTPTPQPPAQPQPPVPNNQQPSVHAPTGVVINPNLGGGGGGGAAQAVRKAVKRTANQNDLRQLHLLIDTFSLSSGQMPTAQQIADALRKEAPHIYTLWDEKVIYVTGARVREHVWAYTVEPQTTGGEHLFITSSGVDRLTTQALTERLKQEGVR